MEQVQVHCSFSAGAEKRAIAGIWNHIEVLLAGGCEAFVSGLVLSLPDPSSFQSAELPLLAKLHLSSAANLMGTLKLLAPAAFAPGSCQPDLSALDDADSGLLSMAATLIELQLFHLSRAAALTATSRKRLAQQRADVQGGAWSLSNDSSSAGSSQVDSEQPSQ